jgi:hypothetical protein
MPPPKTPFNFPNLPDIANSPMFKAIESARKLAAHGTIVGSNVSPFPRIPHPAELMCERLRDEIIDFEKALDLDHEVGVNMVQAGTMTVIHVEHVGYHGRDMVTFDGRDSDGNRVRIVQHVSQVSIALKALPKLSEKPIRLGFLTDAARGE